MEPRNSSPLEYQRLSRPKPLWPLTYTAALHAVAAGVFCVLGWFGSGLNSPVGATVIVMAGLLILASPFLLAMAIVATIRGKSRVPMFATAWFALVTLVVAYWVWRIVTEGIGA